MRMKPINQLEYAAVVEVKNTIEEAMFNDPAIHRLAMVIELARTRDEVVDAIWSAMCCLPQLAEMAKPVLESQSPA